METNIATADVIHAGGRDRVDQANMSHLESGCEH
jgi:hypothetical protein